MARIRTIKPEFPQSESTGSVSREARLLFILLLTDADDEGRLRGASRRLASALYPYDDDAPALIDGWLGELEQSLMIHRYVIEGSTYIQIVNWLKHQKIDRPSPSRLPAFVDASRQISITREHSPNNRETSAKPPEPSPISSEASTTDLGPRTEDQEGIEDQSRSIEADRPAPAPSRFNEFWEAYPRRDGPNPRKPAETKFNALVKTGVDPQMMIAAAKKLAQDEANRGNVGSRFIPQAITWLNQQRWADHAAVAMLQELDPNPEETLEKAVALYAKIGHWPRGCGPEPGLTGCRASPTLLARHGLKPNGLPDNSVHAAAARLADGLSFGPRPTGLAPTLSQIAIRDAEDNIQFLPPPTGRKLEPIER